MFDALKRENKIGLIESTIDGWQISFFKEYNKASEFKLADDTLKYEIDYSEIEDEKKLELKDILEARYREGRHRIVDKFFNNRARVVDTDAWSDIFEIFILRIAMDAETVDKNSFVFAKSRLGASNDTNLMFEDAWGSVQKIIDSFIAK